MQNIGYIFEEKNIKIARKKFSDDKKKNNKKKFSG